MLDSEYSGRKSMSKQKPVFEEQSDQALLLFSPTNNVLLTWIIKLRPLGLKTFFMLNSTEHEFLHCS